MLTGAGSRAKIKYAVGARYGSEKKNNNFRSTTRLLTTTSCERKWGGGAGVYLMSPAASLSSFDMLLFPQFAFIYPFLFSKFRIRNCSDPYFWPSPDADSNPSYSSTILCYQNDDMKSYTLSIISSKK